MIAREPQQGPHGAPAEIGGPTRTPDQPSWLRDIEHGSGQPPPQGRLVRFGRFTAVLMGTELRYLCIGEREVIRRITVAVRDTAWGTIEPSTDGLDVRQGDDDVDATCDVTHSAGSIVLDSRIHIAGSDAGVEFSMDGTCASGFDYNRIGICVLLPPTGYAGARYASAGPSGAASGTLPELVGPQRIEGALILPLFPAFDLLEVALPDGLQIELALSGDLFEMEDQRNWTDASFKIYSTPLALPRPRVARAGDRLRQAVVVRVSSRPS